MGSKFRPGDRVRAVETASGVKQGKEYTVIRDDGSIPYILTVEDDNGAEARAYDVRFEAVVPRVNKSRPFQVGDRVRANETSEANSVFEGQEYTVTRVIGNGNETLLDLDDGLGRRYAHRFDLVEPETIVPETFERYDARMLPMFTVLAEEANRSGYCAEYDRLARMIGAPSRDEIEALTPANNSTIRDAWNEIPIGGRFDFTDQGSDKREHIKISDTQYLHQLYDGDYMNASGISAHFGATYSIVAL